MDFSGMMGRLKEMVPKPRPEVNLSFDEYVDVLYGIVEQCANDVCQSDEVHGLCSDSADETCVRAREVGVWQVVLLSAMKLWNSSGRFKDKVKEALEDEMIARVISGLSLSNDDAEAFRGGYFDMAARGALSSGYDGAEDALNAATEKSSMRVLDMERMVVHLAQSSVVDGNTALMKHPRFYVAQ